MSGVRPGDNEATPLEKGYRECARALLAECDALRSVLSELVIAMDRCAIISPFDNRSADALGNARKALHPTTTLAQMRTEDGLRSSESKQARRVAYVFGRHGWWPVWSLLSTGRVMIEDSPGNAIGPFAALEICELGSSDTGDDGEAGYYRKGGSRVGVTEPNASPSSRASCPQCETLVPHRHEAKPSPPREPLDLCAELARDILTALDTHDTHRMKHIRQYAERIRRLAGR